MSLKNIKQDLFGMAHFVGVDFGTQPDYTVTTMACGNCGTQRVIDDHLVLEECTNCGDPEKDLLLSQDLQASAPCGNCGFRRAMHGTILEKCPHCGDPERDVKRPPITTNERDANENQANKKEYHFSDSDSPPAPIS